MNAKQGEYSVQAGRHQRRGNSKAQKSQPDSANDHQKTVSKKQHGPKAKSVKTLVATRAAKVRTSIRVGLSAPGGRPATPETPAVEVE